MKECKKENIAYKVEAMKCMGNLLEGYKVDQFEDMWNLITPVLKVKGHVKDKYLSKGESHFKVTYILVVKRLLYTVIFALFYFLPFYIFKYFSIFKICPGWLCFYLKKICPV